MMTHARSEQLVATAIDFGLTPAEHTDLADHLATCTACRALAAAYRADAVALHEIAFAQPPARVRSAVLTATARPAARTIQTWKLLAAAALLLAALLGATLALGAWNTRPTLVVVVPTPSPSTEPAVTPAPTAAASPVEALSELQVACDGTRTEILTPLVRAQADGIHIDFANTSGRDLTFGIEGAFGGETLPAVGGTFVYTFGPGSYQITCAETLTGFVIVDPDGLYTSSEVGCAGGTIGTSDYVAGARGPRGPLLDIARTQLHGLEPGDVVERAGYPQAAGTGLVRVVRQGQVVAVLEYADDGHGGWLISGTRACPGSNITTK